MIILKSPQEIEIMSRAGKILAEILKEIKESVKEGISGRDLELKTENLIKKYNLSSSFKNYSPEGRGRPFPSCLCVSIDQELVHGIPSERKFKKGDLVSLDLGIKYQGMHADAAISFICQEEDCQQGQFEEKKKLIQATKQALDIGIGKAKAGNFLEEIGQAIEEFIEGQGFFVVRALSGHGIGRELHEEPVVLNFKDKSSRAKKIKIEPGMCFTIEPMVCLGTSQVKYLKNGWTVVSSDQSLCCHFEQTIAITKKGTQVLTEG